MRFMLPTIVLIAVASAAPCFRRRSGGRRVRTVNW